MQTQPTVEKKIAAWMTAFNSISNKQSEEARILKDLVLVLKEKIVNEGMIIIPGRLG